LETQKECLYVFPIPGKAIIFSVYQQKIRKELLKSSSIEKLNEDNLVESIGLDFLGVDMQSRCIKGLIERYVAVILRHVYRNYNKALLGLPCDGETS
jgi:hypothetical protein